MLSRLINSKAAQKHLDQLNDYAPKTEAVHILKLTEKQYANISYLTGGPDIKKIVELHDFYDAMFYRD